MKKRYLIVLICFLVACQKGIEPFDDNSDSDQNGTDITGTWNFVSLEAHTQSTVEYEQDDTDYKATTLSDYTTINNTGTITFDSSDLSSAGVGYDISSTLNVYNYKNNILTDSAQLPFNYSIDSSSSTGTYKIIGTDSIYFPQGGFVSYNGISQQSMASGGKFSINGNTLTITQQFVKDTTEVYGDIANYVTESGTVVVQLQKK
ncbi:MAG TPA: hypothetical protein VHB70_02035 [Parafilimonas sp.]|nr:hypothetical protein [Parafilimonas sp.]